MAHIPTLRDAPNDAQTEGGFGLIEVLITMVIVAILMAVAIPSYQSAKRSARYKDTASAASGYKAAVASFMLDNGNLVPNNTFAQWPDAAQAAGGTGPHPMGPKNLLGKNYMKSGMPDSIRDGTMKLYRGGSWNAPPGGVSGKTVTAINLWSPSVTQYEFVVLTRDGPTKPWTPRCATGNMANPLGAGMDC